MTAVADLAAAPTRPAHGHLPPGLDLGAIAGMRSWLFHQSEMLDELHGRFGDVATLRFIGGRQAFLTRAPADIERLFKAPPHEVPSAVAGSPIGPFVGENSLLTLNGRRHLRHRKLLLPPFHGDRMRAYTDDIRAIAAAEVDTWSPGTVMELQPRMQAITLEVIIRIVFGVDDRVRRAELRDAVLRLIGFTSNRWAVAPTFIAATRLGRLIGPAKRLAADVDRLIHREIAHHRDAGDLEDRPDVLSMLLASRDEDGEPLGDLELRDELVTLLFAGHETTATALSWAFERLVRTPDAMELATAAALEGDDEVLDATFQETLRLRPVVPATPRLLRAPMELSGYALPADQLVVISILGAGRHPDRYEDPDRFDPRRYVGAKPDAYTWVPFGGGVRRCIGAAFANLEAREVLREVLRRTRLEAVDPEPERISRRHITIVPGEGARVAVVRVDR